MCSLLPAGPGLRVDADAADAAGDQPEEDVGGGDEPEGEDVDGGVAVVGVARPGRVHHRLVDAVHPHATWGRRAGGRGREGEGRGRRKGGGRKKRITLELAPVAEEHHCGSEWSLSVVTLSHDGVFPTNIGIVRCTVSVATIVVVGAGVDI